MSIWKKLFGGESRTPATSAAVASTDTSESAEIFVQKAEDPPMRIDPSLISHVFIAMPLEQVGVAAKSEDLVVKLNRTCQPRLWAAPIRASTLLCAMNTPKNDYPDPRLLLFKLKEQGMAASSSIVLNTADVSLDGGKTTSKVIIGFAFNESKPRIIFPKTDRVIPK
jgi:hypothetical protein